MARILVLDDDPDVRSVLEAALNNAGHAVRGAGDGAAGLRLAREHTFDLVVTDMMMPEKDGFEVINALRAADPRLPIVAISSGGRTQSPVYLKIAQTLGVDATLTKPIKPDALVECVEAVLKSRRD